MYGSCILFSYRVVSRRSRCYSSSSSKRLLEILANMPKPNSARIAEAQRQRQHISRKSEKYGPSTVYLQVLGSGAKGAPNTLYLFTDQKRYMFNCGECTQRLAHEHKVKLSKLDHIFITSKTWRNIGGLPGLSLTLQDVGVPNITLHGPDGLDELYNATKRFVIMKDMNVTMANCSPNVDFEDNVMNVKYVLLGPHEDLLTAQALKPHVKKPKPESATPERDYEEFIHDDTDYYKPERRNYKEKPKVKSSAEKADAYKKKNEKVLHELQKKTHCSIAFICTLKKRLGTLDLAKCVELGVKPGPMLGQLKSGQDVVLPDGSLVLSKDVKTPDDPGPVFIVLDVPDPTHLKEAEFQAHFNNGINPPENVPVLIVHFTPPHVFNHPKYIAFMSMFGPDTRHLVLNSKNTCLGSEAVHRTQHKLHLLDPDIFPLLRDVSMPAVWNSPPTLPKTNSPVRLKGLEELKNKIALAQFQNIINLEGPGKGDGGELVVEGQESNFKFEVLPGRTLTMFHLRPKRELDRSAEPKLHIQDYIEETMDADGFANSLQQFRRLVDALRYAKSDTQEYPKVVFLGTGSCIPSKTRNTSAIVVHIDENRSMLLDCGEGTLGQLVRFYGAKKVNAFLRTLQAIYISHLHADHHIGLIGVLQARRQALKEVQHQQRVPVLLFAPGQIVTWLTLYDQQFERIKNDYTLIPNQTLLEDEASRVELTAAELSAVGVHGVTTCLVAHCPNAFGVAIQINSQYKLTYSGDTLPCKELVRIGENSTLLIHEATMEDELVEEARLKMHSTTTQAIDIGRQMNARYTVLTHFSQRYARLPRLNANILNNNQSVGIAFDNMQITMSDLELLPHMYAPLQLMFAEHCVEMELKAAHRQSLRERRALSPPSEPSEPEWGSGGTSPVSKSQVRGSRPSSGSKSFTPQASYRESNSSRLRQELKGMAISGTIGKVPNLRSRSSSSARTTTQSPNRYPQYHQSRSDHAKQSRSPKASTGNESLDKKSPANKSPVNKSPVNKSPVHKSPVNKSPAHKSPVYKSAAHRSPANKSPDTMSLDNKCPDIKPPLSQSPDNKSPDNESSDNESPHNECPDNKSPDNKSPDNKSPDSKSPDLASTPRSVSQSSNLTKDHRQERPRPRCDFTETVINSRSKTLNSVPYRAVPQEVLVATAHGVTANSGKRTSFSNPPSPPTFAKPNDANAYGKPLVTSLNKKLMIRRQTTPQPTSRKRYASISTQTMSTDPRYLTVEESKMESGDSSKIALITAILTHIIYWRVAYFLSLLFPKWRCLVFKIIAFGILFWTAIKGTVSGNKLRASSTIPYTPIVLPDTKIPVPKNRFGPRPPRPSILRPNISYAIKTPTKESTSRDNKPKETMSTPQNKLPKKDPRKQKPEGRLSTPSSPIRSKSPISKPQTGTGKTSPVHTKRNETYNEMRPKPPTIREPASTIPNTTQFRKHSSRSFKPQLDDIKSSYLLLNKNMPDFNSKTSVNSAPKQSRISIPTHNVIDDEIRRQELMKVKKKFLSRKFWGDSKYDKIEGLNWISWK